MGALFALAWCVGTAPGPLLPRRIELGSMQISESLGHFATQRPLPQARISTNSQSCTHAPHRGSHRDSTKSNHSAHPIASERSARPSVQTRRSRQSDHTERSQMSTFSRMMSLSQAGEDFRHHFRTNSSVLSEIVGATGQKSVMQLGSRLPSLGMLGAASVVRAGHG